jgi:hypothetical protein
MNTTPIKENRTKGMSRMHNTAIVAAARIRFRRGIMAFLFGTGLAWLLSGCEGEKLSGTTTETVSGKSTGIIRLADGKAAASARVRVFPVDYRPAADSGRSIAFQTLTDEKGRYYIDSLAAGEYNLLSDLKGQAGYQDSVFLSGAARTLDTLSLRDPGDLAGYVALEPGDPTITVIVQVLGTQAFANVNAKGFFRLPSLPPGEYTAAVSTTLDNYTTGYFPIAVRAGRHDTLADTLRPPFSGIQQVTGIKVVYDTLNGVARLTWDKSEYPYLKEYLVFRDGVPATVLSQAPLTSTTDTVFADSLYDNPFELYGDRSRAPAVSAHKLQYRVAIRDQFGFPGRSFGSKEITAVTPAQVFTFGTISFPDFPNGYAGLLDTVKIVVQFENKGRRIRRIRWQADRFDIAARVVQVDTHSGNDTLVFVCPRSMEYGTFHANLLDDAGMEWTISKPFYTYSIPPKVSLTVPSDILRSGDSVALSGRATLVNSRVVKWEWDFGAKGAFQASSGPDTVWHPDISAGPRYPIVLRATDEYGFTGADTAYLDFSRWKQGASFPQPMVAYSAALKGKLYVAARMGNGSAQSFYAYDPDKDAWETLPDLPMQVLDGAMTAGDDRVFLASKEPALGLFSYDPATRAWETLTAPYYLPSGFSAVYNTGAIQILGGRDFYTGASSTIYEYRTDNGQWSNHHLNFQLQAYGGEYPSVVTLHGNFYAYSLTRTFGYLEEVSTSVSSAGNMKTTGSLALASPWVGYTATEAGILALVLDDGDSERAGSTRAHLFDPVTRKWSEQDPLLQKRRVGNVVALGKRVFAIGDPDNATGDPGRLEWIDLE